MFHGNVRRTHPRTRRGRAPWPQVNRRGRAFAAALTEPQATPHEATHLRADRASGGHTRARACFTWNTEQPTPHTRHGRSTCTGLRDSCLVPRSVCLHPADRNADGSCARTIQPTLLVHRGATSTRAARACDHHDLGTTDALGDVMPPRDGTTSVRGPHMQLGDGLLRGGRAEQRGRSAGSAR